MAKRKTSSGSNKRTRAMEKEVNELSEYHRKQLIFAILSGVGTVVVFAAEFMFGIPEQFGINENIACVVAMLICFVLLGVFMKTWRAARGATARIDLLQSK